MTVVQNGMHTCEHFLELNLGLVFVFV